MLKKLINVSYFMIIVSIVSVSDTLTQTISNFILAGVAAGVGWYIKQLVDKISEIYNWHIQHKEKHVAIEQEIQRIETESKEQYEELSTQISKVDTKLDVFMKEIRKQNA